MRSILAPLITAAVLVDAATHYPIQYFHKPEATSTPTVDVRPNTVVPSDSVAQTGLVQDVDIKSTPTQPNVAMPITPGQPDDTDDLVSDEESEDMTTPTEFDDSKQGPKLIKPGPAIDFQDPELLKPAGIEFPDGEPTGTEFPNGKPTGIDFDRVEIKTATNYTTSTIYTTVTSTATDCISTVTYCPEKGTVVTKTISLYTTVCPITTPTSVTKPTQVSPPTVESEIPDSEDRDDSENRDDSDDRDDQDDSEAPEPTPVSYMTKTIETTIWYTVTDCPPQETKCPEGLETSSISTYTEVYPITDIPRIGSNLSPNSTKTSSSPYVTRSPSDYPKLPVGNVTVTTTPPKYTVDSGSAYKANSLLMCFGVFAGTVITLLQGWY